MPKMIIHAPAGTFDAAGRQQVARALTQLGLDCEALPDSPLVRSTVWTYFAEYSSDAVFMGVLCAGSVRERIESEKLFIPSAMLTPKSV